jgi:hypothetical protein
MRETISNIMKCLHYLTKSGQNDCISKARMQSITKWSRSLASMATCFFKKCTTMGSVLSLPLVSGLERFSLMIIGHITHALEQRGRAGALHDSRSS